MLAVRLGAIQCLPLDENFFYKEKKKVKFREFKNPSNLY